ncbi:hypothetical protein PMAYCL1PPCAC_14236, partial [Pristionchus mayeri]
VPCPGIKTFPARKHSKQQLRIQPMSLERREYCCAAHPSGVCLLLSSSTNRRSRSRQTGSPRGGQRGMRNNALERYEEPWAHRKWAMMRSSMISRMSRRCVKKWWRFSKKVRALNK